MLSQELLTGEQLTLLSNVAHYALAEGREVPSILSVRESSPIDEFDLAKEGRDRFLEKVDTYKMKNDNLEKTLLEKRIAMNAMKWSLVDLKRALNRLTTEKSLILASCRWLRAAI